jgi:hypothetical protein
MGFAMAPFEQAWVGAAAFGYMLLVTATFMLLVT